MRGRAYFVYSQPEQCRELEAGEEVCGPPHRPSLPTELAHE